MTGKIKNSETLELTNDVILRVKPEGSSMLKRFFAPLRMTKPAFTLAEVLITLAIIGVVAALTIPNLLANFQSKQFDSGDKVFYNKLNEALRIMNTQQVLAGHGTTEKFVTELQKHLKIAHVCTETPSDCFADTVTWGDAGDADITKIKLSKDLATEDYGTNVVGIQFANGMSALLAYNPKCNPDPYSNQSNVMECVAVLYDTNANATPNSLTQDVRKTANVKELKTGCLAETPEGTCVVKTKFNPEPIDCTESENQKYCDGWFDYEEDYWAGANKACEEAGGQLPTMVQLAQIASDIYGTTIGENEYKYGLSFPTTENQYGITSGDYLWSVNDNNLRSFMSSSTAFHYSNPRGDIYERYDSYPTICVK